MAATLDETAHGIVSILSHAPLPEPLRVDLKGHSYAEAIYLAQAVADECAAADVPLSSIEIGMREGFIGKPIDDPKTEWASVHLVTNESLGSAVQFWRWSK